MVPAPEVHGEQLSDPVVFSLIAILYAFLHAESRSV